MKTITTLLLLALFSLNLLAQETELSSLMKERNEFYFSFEINDLKELDVIARDLSVDAVEGNKVIAYANNKQYERFLKRGIETTLLTPPSMFEDHKMFDGRTRAEYEWDQYPTYEAYVAMMEEFAESYPEKCTLIELGTLASGRKILLARINNGETDGKPKFLYGSTIHGDETTGFIMMLRLIDLLLTRDDLPEVQNVLENIDLFVCPNANPDGTYHGGNHTVNGATRSNANGVDMNRNYPDPVDGAHPDGEAYAVETQWFMQFAEDYQFTMSAHFHGGAEVMNYPWDNNYDRHADDAWWQLVSREYADLAHEQNSNYMTDLNNGITNGADWYRIGGGRQDYMNYYMQCREVTIECSTTKCPSASQLPTFWEYNYESIFAYMNQSLYGIHGIVRDAQTKQPVAATIEILDHDQDYSMVKSQLPAGDFHRPIKAGTYNVLVTANGYLPAEYEVTVVDGETTYIEMELESGEGLIPDFEASVTNVSPGSTVNFTDKTWGANIVSWCWTFEGGNPSTSIEQNPSVTYENLGRYDVRLTATNANGDSKTVVKKGFITVMEMYNMQDETVTTCDALFYDGGGLSNNYQDNENCVMTFLPGIEGAMIEVEFLKFDTENGYDKLYVYDGTEMESSTCLAELSGSSLPGKYVASNTEGALTFRFESDYLYNDAGWEAVVRCVGGDMSVEIETSDEEICLGDKISLSAKVSGGSGDYAYSWSPAELFDDPEAQYAVATPTEAGEVQFTLTVNDGVNVQEASVTVVVEDCADVDEQNLDRITIYPNPARDAIYVSLDNEAGGAAWTLINMQGQLVKSSVELSNDFVIQIDDIRSGFYFLNVDVEGRQHKKKIVVE